MVAFHLSSVQVCNEMLRHRSISLFIAEKLEGVTHAEIRQLIAATDSAGIFELQLDNASCCLAAHSIHETLNSSNGC